MTELTTLEFTRRIAIAGNPNSGKTTLFNALTGSRYQVGNYPGVTVEKREGRIRLQELEHCTIEDLPGLYSLVGTSPDERVAMDSLVSCNQATRPDVVLVVVDQTNLARHLFLVSQLIDCGLPLIIVLTMKNLATRQGIKIYSEKLSHALDLPVIAVEANQKKDLEELRKQLIKTLHEPHSSRHTYAWCDNLHLTASLNNIALTLPLCLYAPDNKQNLFIACGLLSQNIRPGDLNRFFEMGCLETPETATVLRQEQTRLRTQSIDPLTAEATWRYRWINNIVKTSSAQQIEQRNWTRTLDRLVTHRVYGVLIFLLVMAFIFQATFTFATVPIAWIEAVIVWIGKTLGSAISQPSFRSLVVDGVIAGVGSILVFVPQIAILFFLLGLLQDSGYLPRAACLMDRVMRIFGLQGRSFVPLLNCFACTVPGIMATRTIPSWSDRLATILIAPLMSCSARLPVYSILIAAFIPPHNYFGLVSLQGLMLLGLYLLGIVAAAIAGWVFKHTLAQRTPTFFLMELPTFRRPVLKLILRETLDRVIVFLRTAGTIILAASVILWYLASYPTPDPNMSPRQAIEQSYAGKLGHLIEPVIRPLGYNWELGVALISSFAAREVFVSTLATVYNLQDSDEPAKSLINLIQDKSMKGEFSLATAMSLLVFFVFACQCSSTIAVAKRETNSWLWPTFMFSYLTISAYGAAWLVYRITTWLLLDG